MTSTLRGWLIREKGLFYLGTTAGWWRLDDVKSGLLKEWNVRPNTPVLVQGEQRPARVLRVESLRAMDVAHGNRLPPLVADPVPHLHTASDLRLAAHVWLRRVGYLEVGLPVLRSDTVDGHTPAVREAVATGLDQFFAFARYISPDQLLPEGERLLVVDVAGDIDTTTNLTGSLVAELATHTGVRLDGASFVRVTMTGDPYRFEIPDAWPEKARLALRNRLRDAGGTVDEITRPDGHVVWVVEPGADPQRIRHLLDAADAVAMEGAGPPWQLAPTWCVDPATASAALLLSHLRVATVHAPEGGPGVAWVGWEELLTVLCQLRSPSDAQLLPRGISWPWIDHKGHDNAG